MGTAIGAIMRERRLELGLSQEELAAKLFRTQQWVSMIERGKRTIHTLDDLRWVADRTADTEHPDYVTHLGRLAACRAHAAAIVVATLITVQAVDCLPTAFVPDALWLN